METSKTDSTRAAQVRQIAQPVSVRQSLPQPPIVGPHVLPRSEPRSSRVTAICSTAGMAVDYRKSLLSPMTLRQLYDQ